MKAANFNWMKGMETKKTATVAKAMRQTGRQMINIAVKGKTHKAFQ